MVEPHSEAGGIHSRLLCRQRCEQTLLKFRECFSAARSEQLHKPIEYARACAKVGRFELAATYYNQALERQPGNWVLLSEISMFLTYSLRDLKAGIDMAKSALRLNPSCSAELGNTLGCEVSRLQRLKRDQANFPILPHRQKVPLSNFGVSVRMKFQPVGVDCFRSSSTMECEAASGRCRGFLFAHQPARLLSLRAGLPGIAGQSFLFCKSA